MDMDIRIRPLANTDFDDLRQLYSQLTDDAPVPDGAVGRGLLAEILDHPGTTLFGAEVNGRVVSVASLHVVPNLTFGGRPHARIENVVTDNAYRGRGLGRQVVGAALAEVERRDCISVMLLTGKAAGARAFYEQCGFDADLKFGMIRRYPRGETVE